MLTWPPRHRALGQLARRRGRLDAGNRSDASMGGVSGHTADLTQVRSTLLTCRRMPHSKHQRHGGKVQSLCPRPLLVATPATEGPEPRTLEPHHSCSSSKEQFKHVARSHKARNTTSAIAQLPGVDTGQHISSSIPHCNSFLLLLVSARDSPNSFAMALAYHSAIDALLHLSVFFFADVLCYLCSDENLESSGAALEWPVFILLPKGAGLVRCNSFPLLLVSTRDSPNSSAMALADPSAIEALLHLSVFCFADVLCYLCSDENLASPGVALELLVFVLLPKGAGLVHCIEP
ncbi:hypothetical protein BHM03_00019142 [Ensete ventricosum]|nr:hypothetical protein BHM03_00019142 [Ensete ventricosum]